MNNGEMEEGIKKENVQDLHEKRLQQIVDTIDKLYAFEKSCSTEERKRKLKIKSAELLYEFIIDNKKMEKIIEEVEKAYFEVEERSYQYTKTAFEDVAKKALQKIGSAMEIVR